MTSAIDMQLQCVSGTWQALLQITDNLGHVCQAVGNAADAGSTCSPLNLVFSGLVIHGVPSGNCLAILCDTDTVTLTFTP